MFAVSDDVETSSTTGTRSNTRCANTVPTSVAHAPLRRGILRVSTATRASSPIRPGSTAFANSPTENAEKTSADAGCGGGIAESDHGRPRERARDDREEVERDRDGDPLPPDRANASPIPVKVGPRHQSSAATPAANAIPTDEPPAQRIRQPRPESGHGAATMAVTPAIADA